MTVEYNQDDLCEHIANGKSLVSWCKLTGIGYSTIMAHLANDTVFQEKYTRAREDQADYLVDEIIEIADEAPTEPITDGLVVKYDATAIARNRLRVDTRKWAASKMKPKKYGDKLDLNHAGGIKTERGELSEADRAIINDAIDHKLSGGKNGKFGGITD